MSNTTIRATVIQLNSWLYACDGGLGDIGEVQDISCNPQQEDAEYWAVPQKDQGIFTRLDYVLISDFPTQPTFDSFRVFRISDKLNGYITWILGTFDDYRQACSVCCGNPAYPMPTATPSITPCQTLCETNANGVTYETFALPTLLAGQTYHPSGAYNNFQLPSANPAGYATPALLLTFLNTFWNQFVWTLSSDNLTLIATGGIVGDVLCAIIRPVVPYEMSLP